jgi:hypothetical protein
MKSGTFCAVRANSITYFVGKWGLTPFLPFTDK